MQEETVVKHKRPKSSEKRKELIPCLIVVEGGNLGEIYYISKNSVSLGRGENVDVFLPEEGVSRNHARIDCHEGTYMVSDLASKNGTFINGEQVEQAALREGDKLRIGDVVLRFSFQDMMDIDYQAKLRNMTMRDSLTRLFNQRYLLDALMREINFAQRNRQPISLLMIDVDEFKKINETEGQAAGDTVLKGIARRLQAELRSYDIAARYGGEEFVILLRGTPLDNALLLAERLRKQIGEQTFDLEKKKMTVTVSIGVSALDPDRGGSPDDLTKQADRFLKEAKERGRNKVVSMRNTEGM